jgi:hypothetical protein
MGRHILVIMTFITGKYPRNLLKQRNYVVAESATFIVITGISPYRTLLLRLLLTPLSVISRFPNAIVEVSYANSAFTLADWR